MFNTMSVYQSDPRLAPPSADGAFETRATATHVDCDLLNNPFLFSAQLVDLYAALHLAHEFDIMTTMCLSNIQSCIHYLFT